jgi:antibiotic biosynthesis monooxygenase (ABM) superfamily enzyme
LAYFIFVLFLSDLQHDDGQVIIMSIHYLSWTCSKERDIWLDREKAAACSFVCSTNTPGIPSYILMVTCYMYTNYVEINVTCYMYTNGRPSFCLHFILFRSRDMINVVLVTGFGCCCFIWLTTLLVTSAGIGKWRRWQKHSSRKGRRCKVVDWEGLLVSQFERWRQW